MKTAEIVVTILLAVFAAALIVWEYRRKKPRRLLYKTLASAMFLLLGIFARIENPGAPAAWLCAGLVFSMAGDVLLALFDNTDMQKRVHFIGGVLAFSAAQVCYAVSFGILPSGWHWGAAVIGVLIGGGAMLAAAKMKMQLQGVRGVVFFYSVLLSHAFGLALLGALSEQTTAAALAAAGMAVFLLSDLFLLFKYFAAVRPRCLTALNLAAYYLAQGMLCWAMIIR